MPDMQPSEILARIPGELMNAHTTGAIHAVINRAEKAIATHQRQAVIQGKIEVLKMAHQDTDFAIRWDRPLSDVEEKVEKRIATLEAELGDGIQSKADCGLLNNSAEDVKLGSPHEEDQPYNVKYQHYENGMEPDRPFDIPRNLPLD